eukprot:Unigene1606_Nuclearia_a/m.4970 Unigene1606_Nuclearia_a/g.4970  ORF Unigene1606_Nuclearia_a/g.4970 Unigene1606_Nuclearia_a/m.4970 type:complete len:404 (+) Unigene1606_Nuclearia_a:1253-2464(+)
MLRQAARDLAHGLVHVRLERIGRAHDVAVDVAAGREGVHQDLVDVADALAELALDDAVELEGLPRREPDGAVGVRVGNAVHGQPLCGRADAAGHTHADHEREGLLLLESTPLLAQVAVVLLVDTVELGQHRVLLCERARALVLQALRNRPAQKVADGFDGLGRLGGRGRRGGRLGHDLALLGQLLPDLRVPRLEAGLVAVEGLVVADAARQQGLGAELLQSALHVDASLAEKMLVLGPRPVVRVAERKDRERDLVQPRHRRRAQSLPKLTRIGRHLALAGRRYEHEHVGLVGQLVNLALVQCHQPHGLAAPLALGLHAPRQLLGVAAVRAVEDKQRIALEAADEAVERGSGVLLDSTCVARCQVLLNGRRRGTRRVRRRGRRDEQTELVFTVDKGFELGAQLV